jgi:predicted 3-demethylubiquinone-9 3-methyltransferase (glyoxalase superfamily)
MTDATPFLMFEGRAEEALDFYIATVPESRIEHIDRYGAGEPGPEGSVRMARAVVAGLPILASDSFVQHAFTFTPSISFMLTCKDEDEVERLAAALGEGGGVLMPVGNYGFSRKFAWVNDRFGVSWQVNLP